MLHISIAGGGYSRTRELWAGCVKPRGVEPACVRLPPAEAIFRMARYEQFDVSEFSLSALAIEASLGLNRFVAIPVFPARAFRHRDIYVGPQSTLSSPADLKGKRVGIQRYHVTSLVWVRGLLSDVYGITPQSIRWRKADVSRRGQPPVRISIELPADVTIDLVTDSSIDEMLVSGEVDAAILPHPPPSYFDPSSGVRTLFADPAPAERDYFHETGIFPIMHCVVIRRELYQRHPWLAVSLQEAYEAARLKWAEEARELGIQELASPFAEADYVAQVAHDIGEMWPYGIDRNKRTLQTALRYAAEQGLTRQPVRIEDLFAREFLDSLDREIPAASELAGQGSTLPPDKWVLLD